MKWADLSDCPACKSTDQLGSCTFSAAFAAVFIDVNQWHYSTSYVQYQHQTCSVVPFTSAACSFGPSLHDAQRHRMFTLFLYTVTCQKCLTCTLLLSGQWEVLICILVQSRISCFSCSFATRATAHIACNVLLLMQVTHYTESPDGVTVHFDRGRPAVNAKILIGADGYFSKIRQLCLDDGPPLFAVRTLPWPHTQCASTHILGLIILMSLLLLFTDIVIAVFSLYNGCIE